MWKGIICGQMCGAISKRMGTGEDHQRDGWGQERESPWEYMAKYKGVYLEVIASEPNHPYAKAATYQIEMQDARERRKHIRENNEYPITGAPAGELRRLDGKLRKPPPESVAPLLAELNMVMLEATDLFVRRVPGHARRKPAGPDTSEAREDLNAAGAARETGEPELRWQALDKPEAPADADRAGRAPKA